MALVTYPLNNIEYSAEDAELFHVTRTSGIYAKNSFDYSVTGADSNIVIGTGIGWIKNSEFSGKVIAQKEAISLDMGLPDSVYPRIDAIIIQFDSNRNETNIVVKKGTAASNPVAPSVVQNESVYELHLYHVRREAGSFYITPNNITDLRLNGYYCGLMTDSVTNIDTTTIEKQVSDLIKSLQDEISSVKDGSAYLHRDGSTNMTGNLPMDGHKVTGLGTPTADGDAVNRKYVQENFRPSDWTPTAAEVGARPSNWMPSAADVGAVAKTELKTLAYSQTDSNGDTTHSVLSAYPTTPGVYRVGGTVFSGLPSDAIGYGTLVIFDAGGYFMHLYRDSNSHFYIGRTADGVKIPTAESWKRCFDSDDVIPVINGGTGADSNAGILRNLHSEYPVTTNIATFGSGYENGGHCTPTDLKKAMGIHENFRVYHIDTSMSNPFSSISANWSTILGGPFMLTLKFVSGSAYAYVGYKIDANNGALIELSFGSGDIYKYTVQNGTWTEFAHNV